MVMMSYDVRSAGREQGKRLGLLFLLEEKLFFALAMVLGNETKYSFVVLASREPR